MDWSMIGDLIMLSPCVRAIAQHYPDAEIALLGQPSSIATYKHHPNVNELIPYDRSHGDWDIASFRRTVDVLRAREFDKAFIFHNSFGSALMAFMGRVKERYGFRSEMRDSLLTHRFKRPEIRQHLIETKADMLRASGIPVDDMRTEVFMDAKAARQWTADKLGPNLGRRRPIIAVSLGATMEYKRWTADGLNRYLNSFSVNSADFIFLGGPNERELYSGVYSYNNTVVDLIVQTTMEELVWVIDRADVFVGPDSGSMHIATGRDKPIVALFGATDPLRSGPYKYEKCQVIRSERLCPSCELKFGKHIRQCSHMLDPLDVYYSTIGLLAQYSPRWSFELL
jgi:lipopolysaccharide heptosyltransferase II